jgi:hypothetical protein
MHQKVNSALLKYTADAAAKVKSRRCLLKLTTTLLKITATGHFWGHINPAVKVAPRWYGC